MGRMGNVVKPCKTHSQKLLRNVRGHQQYYENHIIDVKNIANVRDCEMVQYEWIFINVHRIATIFERLQQWEWRHASKSMGLDRIQ